MTESASFMKFPIDGLQLQLGLTNYCNYKCNMCNQTFHEKVFNSDDPNDKSLPLHGGKFGFLPLDLYSKILLNVQNHKLDSISMMWIGESLIHPDFFKMLENLFEKNQQSHFFRNLVLNTNASLLTNKLSDLILNYFKNNPDNSFSFIFSLDAGSEDVYLSTKRTPLYNQTVANIQYFLKEQKRLGVHNICPILQYVVTPQNYDDATNFINLWSSYLKKIKVKHAIVGETSEFADVEVHLSFKLAQGKNVDRLIDLHNKLKAELKLPIYIKEFAQEE